MAAALALGADAVWCGSRFLASKEAEAHDAYKDRVLAADVGDTAILSIYGPEWPDQLMRAIVNDGARAALVGKPKPPRMQKASSSALPSSTARRSRCRATALSCRRLISTGT